MYSENQFDLLELTTTLGQENNLIIDGFPGARFEAELQNFGDGLPSAGHIAGLPHLLLDIQQHLYLCFQFPVSFLDQREFHSRNSRSEKKQIS